MLNWHGHVRRMNEERLPQQILERCPPGGKKKEKEGLEIRGYRK